MTLTSRLLSRLMRLPPAENTDVRVERDLRVPMPDGAVLLADRYVARGGETQPIVLIRSPYGRSGWVSNLWARPFAERGFQAVIQSCRGTFGSGGTFDPFKHEREDGLATLAWLKAQAWYPGAIFSFGQSYVGYAQWAFAREAGPELRAMATQVASGHIGSMTYAGGSFMLANSLRWTRVVSALGARIAPLRQAYELATQRDPLQRVWDRVPPLPEVDVLGIGHPVGFFRDWLANESPRDAFWAPLDFAHEIERVEKPVCMVAGWHDIFVPWQLQEYRALQAAGRELQLSVGPWSHIDLRVNALGIRQALDWFRAHAHGSAAPRRAKPVRLYVGGAKAWREFDTWPPAGNAVRWHLQPGGKLDQAPAPDSQPDSYTFDPARPTPSVGGASLSMERAVVDNRALEARADVITFTSAALPEDITVIGEVSAELWVSSSAVCTDFFVRLCEVDARAVSRNVCDGLTRVRLPDASAPTCVKVVLWPTAHRFARGHRLRVQVSSGAYPRWAANPGTGAPLASTGPVVQQQQRVFHDPTRPSAIVLPVVEA